MGESLDLTLRNLENAVILDIQGELTKPTESQLISAIDTLHLSEGHTLLLNLTEVNYINSAGIALLIRLVRQTQSKKYRAAAYGVSSHYQKLFRMVGLSDFLDIYPDEYAAMQRVKSSI